LESLARQVCPFDHDSAGAGFLRCHQRIFEIYKPGTDGDSDATHNTCMDSYMGASGAAKLIGYRSFYGLGPGRIAHREPERRQFEATHYLAVLQSAKVLVEPRKYGTVRDVAKRQIEAVPSTSFVASIATVDGGIGAKSTVTARWPAGT
jgi:hypothetical protein